MITLWANAVDVAMGIALVYQTTTLNVIWSTLSHFSISLSLNIILTIMIIIRLILHTRNTRTTLEITGTGGFCKSIVTVLVETCALYAVNSLLVIVPTGVGHPISWFMFTLTVTQVRVVPQP